MPKNTQDYAELNVFQKLNIARQKFLEAGNSKSGKNPLLEFKYFELMDIVPSATRIFNEIGLIGIVNFSDTEAVMEVVNTDNPTDRTSFLSPMRFAETNRGVNPVQALGASHTYLRRYLYMMALDICEPDQIEPLLDSEDAPKQEKKNKKPATTQEREEIKKELTAPEEAATELQIEALRGVLNALLDKDSEQEEFVQEIALKTNGFTDITKSKCEQLINGINEMLANYAEG